MADRRWGWEQVSGGALRFYGVEAMREVRELVHDDPAYTWSYPAWPMYWIDVYPHDAQAQNLLLAIVEDRG